MINTATNKIETWVPLPDNGYATAPTSDGKFLVVAMPKANKVAVVDLKTRKVTQTIDVPKSPQEVLIRPDEKMAYLSCDASGKIAAIRTVGLESGIADRCRQERGWPGRRRRAKLHSGMR